MRLLTLLHFSPLYFLFDGDREEQWNRGNLKDRDFPDDDQLTKISIDQLRAGISICVVTGGWINVGQIYYTLTYRGGGGALEIIQTTDDGQKIGNL